MRLSLKACAAAIFILYLCSACAAKNPAKSPETAATATPDALHSYIGAYIGTASFTITKQFSSGFENVSDFNGYYITPQNSTGVSHGLTGTVKYSGNYSHYAFITAANTPVPYTNTNHRGYPAVQLYKDKGVFSGVVFCEFMARINIDLYDEADKNWLSFATLCTYSDDQWQRTLQVNIDRNYRLNVMHVPEQMAFAQDILENTSVVFPRNTWVKISVVIDFSDMNQYGKPYIKAWQDGVLVSGATFNPRVNPETIDPLWWPSCLAGWAPSQGIAQAESMCSLVYAGGLAQAHFGLYAPPLLASGEVWNDDLAIYEIQK